jgi:hypothetical protein
MSNIAGPALLRRSNQLYGWLLTAYPKRHREEYGPAMRQVFRDQCRDAWREGRGLGLMPFGDSVFTASKDLKV